MAGPCSLGTLGAGRTFSMGGKVLRFVRETLIFLFCLAIEPLLCVKGVITFYLDNGGGMTGCSKLVR